ncbi:MAG: FAD-dependent oxidoreductase [Pseudomonadales bacterium]|nr:FAD-binding oxidoreductase [Pseudomonadales bacterium]
MARPRLAVIGGGIAGVSLAARAAADFDVTVLEAESQPGYHSTGRSAAVSIECYENEVVRELTLPGIPWQIQCGARQIGCVTLADRDHLGMLDGFLARWQPVCESLEEISFDELLRWVPVIRPEAAVRVVVERGALALDPHALLESFRRMLQSAGGRIVGNARVSRLERHNGCWQLGWNGTGSDPATLEADVVVNAAGAWADQIGRLAGAEPLGLEPRRRTALLLDTGLNVSGWPLLHRAQEGLYFKPEGGLLMVSPADEHPVAPCDAQPEELDIAIAVERFQETTTLEVKRLSRTWAGLRSFLADEVPAAGFDPGVENFFWLAGQGGFGLQTAPGLSEMAAGLLRGADHPLAAVLSPARFTA